MEGHKYIMIWMVADVRMQTVFGRRECRELDVNGRKIISFHLESLDTKFGLALQMRYAHLLMITKHH